MPTDPDRPWMNPCADPIAQRVHALIFNGLTGALTEFMPLSERSRIADAIHSSLCEGGIEVRLVDGLAELRAVADRAAGHTEGAAT